MEDNNKFICERCGKQHDGTYGSGRFCSKKCSCSRVFSKEARERISKSNKITYSKKIREYVGGGDCKHCGKYYKDGNSLHNHEIRCKENPDRLLTILKTDNFKNYREKYGAWSKGLTKDTDERIKKFSDKLKEAYKTKRLIPSFYGKHHTEETRMKMKKTNGGVRKSIIPYKRGYYKGYHCDSSWELAYVIYNIEHNIKFEQCCECFLYEYEKEIHKYYPDFKEGGVYVEIKNFNSKKFIAKLKQFPFKIRVLYKEDMKPYLDYVISKYGKDFTRLYETNGG